MALYAINGPQVTVVHDFSESSASLIESAKTLQSSSLLNEFAKLLPGSTTSVSGLNDPHSNALAQLFVDSRQADQAAALRMTTEWTLNSLEAIARHLAGIPGRKNLIWISGGFPMNIGLNPAAFIAAQKAGNNQELFQYSDRLMRVARLLSEAQVAVYPIDPAGVRTGGLYQSDVEGQSGASQVSSSQTSGHTVTPGDDDAPVHSTMLAVARQTGGIAFFDNDVAGNMRRAANDGRFSYTLGFYPPELAWDGKYHVLQIKINRPGIRLRARSGYFARAVAELAADRDESLKLAVASPLEAEAIGLKVRVPAYPLVLARRELAVDFALIIDVRDLQLTENAVRKQSNFELVLAQQALDGRLIKAERKAINYDFSAASYQASLQTGLILRESLLVDPSAYRLRIVVRDSTSGSVGSATVPVTRTQ